MHIGFFYNLPNASICKDYKHRYEIKLNLNLYIEFVC